MWKDPIVEETRQLRKLYWERCGNNTDTMLVDVLRRQKQPGENVVTRPARPVQRLRMTA